MRFSIGATFIVAGIAAGYITGLQALSRSGTVTAPDGSKWFQEVVNPKDPYSIYSVGHFRADGMLPPPHSAQLFSRLQDDDGKNLRGDCSYHLSGAALPARWWAISASPAGSPSQAISSNAGEIILTGDDRFELTLSRRAAAGNWLALPESANLKLMLTLQEAYDKDKRGPVSLPTLVKVACE